MTGMIGLRKTIIIWFTISLTINNVEGSVDPVRKQADCEYGITKEYFDKQFEMSREQVDETFDSYCYTDDFSTYKCCLESWMGDSGSIITNYTVEQVTSKNGVRPVEFKKYPMTSNSSIVNNGNCVQFSIPQSGATCKVRIYYSSIDQGQGSHNGQQNQGMSSESSALYYANMIHPEMPYSIHYNIDKEDGLSFIKRTDNIVNITVRTPELHRQLSLKADWQLCVCIATTTEIENRQEIHETSVALEPPSQVESPQVQPLECSYKSYDYTKNYLIETRDIYSLPLDRPFNICAAVGRELFGSFGYDRLCRQMDFSGEFSTITSKAAITLKGNSEVSDRESLLWKVTFVLFGMTVVGIVSCVLFAIYWVKQRSSEKTNKQIDSQKQLIAPQRNNADNHYEEINYGNSEHYYSYIGYNYGSKLQNSDQWRSDSAVAVTEDENRTMDRDGQDAYGDSNGTGYLDSVQKPTESYNCPVDPQNTNTPIDGEECYGSGDAYSPENKSVEEGNNSADVSSGYLSQHSTSSNSSSTAPPVAALLVAEHTPSVTANENDDDITETNRLLLSNNEESVVASSEGESVTSSNESEVHSTNTTENNWYAKAMDLMAKQGNSSDA